MENNNNNQEAVRILGEKVASGRATFSERNIYYIICKREQLGKVFHFKTKEKQPFAQAVEKAVNWWVQKIQQPMNQDNGDKRNPLAFGLLNTVAMNAQAELTKEKIESFEKKLIEVIINRRNTTRFKIELSVDYRPDHLLAEAINFAGINPYCLPCKSYVSISTDNSVRVKHGYGAEIKEI